MGNWHLRTVRGPFFPPFVVIFIWYVVDDGSTGITQSSNPASLDALVRESLTRI
jgi:hypothetical protein